MGADLSGFPKAAKFTNMGVIATEIVGTGSGPSAIIADSVSALSQDPAIGEFARQHRETFSELVSGMTRHAAGQGIELSAAQDHAFSIPGKTPSGGRGRG